MERIVGYPYCRKYEAAGLVKAGGWLIDQNSWLIVAVTFRSAP